MDIWVIYNKFFVIGSVRKKEDASYLKEKYPDEKYDLILIDESQDFYKDWYEALCFAKKDDGQIVFFYDA